MSSMMIKAICVYSKAPQQGGSTCHMSSLEKGDHQTSYHSNFLHHDRSMYNLNACTQKFV